VAAKDRFAAGRTIRVTDPPRPGQSWLGQLLRIGKGSGGEKTNPTAAGMVGGGKFEKTKPICGTKPILGISGGSCKNEPKWRSGKRGIGVSRCAGRREKLREERAKAGESFPPIRWARNNSRFFGWVEGNFPSRPI